MQPPHRSLVRRVSRAIADSREVDWRELDAAPPELRPRLRRLRAIQELAEAFRAEVSGAPPAEAIPAKPSRGRSTGGDTGVSGPLSEDRAAAVAMRDAPRVSAPTRTSPEAPRDPAARRAPAEPGTLFAWGPLLVREKLGEGSFGEVYRAFDPLLRREVALKLQRAGGEASGLSSASSLAHLEEARRLARVRHPNVAAVYGVEVHGGRAGLWTELIDGETLEARVRRAGPLPAEEIVTTGAELCRALAAVHAAGVVHGDIKTSNAMRERGGRVLLLDFGAGPLHGTPLAMAPELFAGARPSVATDLYALGALLFRLATGRYPVSAETEAELLAAHRAGERLRLRDARPDLPAALSDAIERACSSDPASRSAGAAELENALLTALDTLPLGAAEGGPVAVPNNLPALRDRFIGRERDRRLVRRRLASSRLVTIVGMGGCGKTRLARHVAADLAPVAASGLWWIELAPLRRPEQVWGEAARVLALPEAAGRSLEVAILEALREAAALLVLDNCEHLPEGAAGFARRVLDACPGVRVLATSRRPLGLPAELAYRLPPLEVPPEGAPEILRHDAARLFLDRAVRSRPDFVLTAENSPSVGRICRRLEGIPLALELAAARARALELDEIAARLDDNLGLLGQAGGGRPAHHRTIAACIDWSYGLLAPAEQALFRRLSVFSGGWSLPAAERVCADSPGALGRIGGEAVHDLLERLVDHSLVRFQPAGARDAGPDEPPPAGHPYTMLEMIRRFAAGMLAASGEEAALRDRHLDECVARAEEAEAQLRGPEQEAWILRLDAERENFRAAFDWCQRSAEGIEKGFRLVSNLRGYWLVRGHLSEGLRHCDELFARTAPEAPLRGRALLTAASLAWRRGDLATARARAEEAIGPWRASGDDFSLGLGLLGTLSAEEGRHAQGRAELEEAVELTRRTRGRGAIPGLLCNLGVLAANLGDLAGALACYEEALAIYRETGNHQLAAAILGNLAATAMDLGDLPRARALAEEGVAALRATGDRRSLADCLHTASRVAYLQGDLERARDGLFESLALCEETEYPSGVANALLTLGYVTAAEGRPARAACLLAAAERVREQVRSALSAAEQTRLEEASGRLRTELGADAFAAQQAAARAAPWPRLLQYVRGGTEEL